MQISVLNSVLAAVPMPLVWIGTNEKIAAMNPAAETLLGLKISGRHYATVLRQPQVLVCIEGAINQGKKGEARYQGSENGRETVFRVRCAPVFDDAATDGRAGVLVSFEDMSHVEQAGQMRRDFVANVSHELRTPLTAMIGFIETLQSTAKNDPSARDRFLGIMSREAGRMNRLVQDLLSLSRVENAEKMRPTERVNLVALVLSSIQTLRPMAEASGIAIVTTGEGDAIEIQGDPDQLQQVFYNLIENAIKYGGAKGVVTIDLIQIPRDAILRTPAVSISVIDQGNGIESIHLPRLSERFYRVDAHRSREKGGTGLGLAIVKHIVQRHRGRMKIESELGKGSRFSVIFPTV